MKEKKILRSPFDIVTTVLEVEPNIVTKDSAMGETPNWDSLKHMEIIGEIEKSYGITIPNDEIEKYVTMNAIIEVYNRQSGTNNSRQGIKNFLKKFPIIKIFFK